MSEENSKLNADKTQANTEIVLSAKESIDTIYADIQDRQKVIEDLNTNVNNKAEQINIQYSQIEEWYNGFLQAASYLIFTDEVSEDLWALEEDDYVLTLETSGKAILNIQILENGLYTRTPFVDMEFPNDLSVKLRSIAPFAGRLCLYDLMKGSETNV